MHALFTSDCICWWGFFCSFFIHSFNVVYIFWMIDIIVDSPPYLLQPNFFRRFYIGWRGGNGGRHCFYFFEIGSPSSNHIATIKYNVSVDDTFCWALTLFSVQRNLFLAAIFIIVPSGTVQYQKFIYLFLFPFFVFKKEFVHCKAPQKKLDLFICWKIASSLFSWSSLNGWHCHGNKQTKIRVFS